MDPKILSMNKIEYTVIIPHYNIPNLLGRALRSVPESDNIQVIVVDDCSPYGEKLLDLVPELSRNNVSLYSTEKGGSAGRARNVGIDHAKGKWLTFLDADDLLSAEICDIMEEYKDRSEDVMYFKSISVDGSDLTKESNRNIFDYHFDVYFQTGNENLLRFEYDAPWGKFVKKSLIDKFNIRFDQTRYSNDTFFSTAIGVYAPKILVSDRIAYIVTTRQGSLTADNLKSMEEWQIRYDTTLRVQNFLDLNGVRNRRYSFVDFLQLMYKRDRKKYIKEFFKLPMKNKRRYLYCLLRQFILTRK